ncbi:MAG: hypothetical protein RSF67_07335, partial [Clostridia bacterium]
MKWLVKENTFETDNFWYKVTSDNNGYLQDWKTTPRKDILIKSKVSVAAKTKQTYKVSLTLHGTGSEQNIDQGKKFNGKIQVEINNK